MKFEQFRVTPVSLDAAAKLVGGNSTVLKALAMNNVTEYCLPTYAKLVWMETTQEFGIFSYAYDGSDGRTAYYDSNMEQFYADYPVEYHRVVGSVIADVVTPTMHAELQEKVRDMLRELVKTHRIGFLDDVNFTFEEYDAETVELSMDFDAAGDAMDKLWVEYSLQMDIMLR